MEKNRTLVLSGRLVRVSRGREDGVAHATLGRPLAINEEGWKLLDLFREPVTPEEAAAAAGLSGDEIEPFLVLVERFAAAGFLVDPEESEYVFQAGYELARRNPRILTPAAEAFLGSSSGPAEADFQILGIPFDQAASRSGAADGPIVLRNASNTVPGYSDPRNGRFRGIRDSADGRLLLAGASFCDHGNVAVEYWESFEEVYAKISDAASQIAGLGGVPCFLGGDHSVTEPILRQLPVESLFVVQLDAHTDLDELFAGATHHHGNVMARLRRLPKVRGLLQIGIRDVGAFWQEPPQGVTQLGAHRVRSMDPAEVIAYVPEDVPCYVSIDIDVLDPSQAPATGTPLPGGLSLVDVELMLDTLGREREVVGFDLVEVAPDLSPDDLTPYAALRLLLRFLDAIYRRRQGGLDD